MSQPNTHEPRAGRRERAGAGEHQGVAVKAGWKTSTLGDTCEMYQPKTISGKEMVEEGAYPVFGANGVIGRYDKFNHEEPQLLITCRGATCGSVNISEAKSWITGNAMVVRPKNGAIEMRFLEYLFRGGLDISKAITGAAQRQITRTNLAPLNIHSRMLLKNSSGSSASSTKRSRASPLPKPTPKRISTTPAPSSKATSNPSSRSVARGGWRSRLFRCAPSLWTARTERRNTKPREYRRFAHAM